MTPIDRALAFLERQDDPLGVAWVRHIAHDDPAEAVIQALATHQAEDGGFRDIEVDIGAPVSNPFATRMAMNVLASLDPLPDPALPLMQRMATWLESEQGEDGAWRFRPEVYEHRLAPWFAGWTFPSPNPAGSLAGYARRLGIGSERLYARVRKIFDDQATLEEAATGEFYDVQSHFEYFGPVEHPERDAYLDALAANVVATAAKNGYPDAEHFFVQVNGGGADLERRLPAELVGSQLDRVVSEQDPDGGWPSPYDAAWRPWSAASNAVTLARRGGG
jgi:hypothetical protein